MKRTAIKIFAIMFVIILSAFSLNVLADAPELGEDETKIDEAVVVRDYYASVTINSAGNGLRVGTYKLLSEISDPVGLYYAASDANGSNKILTYIYGEYADRHALGSIETLTATKGEYQMYKMENTKSWKPGVWTGDGIDNTIYDFGIGKSGKYLIPYYRVLADYAEKIYLFSNDKTETLAKYKTQFGEDSKVYKLVSDYYGTLDEDGIASALAEAQNYAKSQFENNIVYYAFESDEIIPVNEMKTFKFSSYKQQGAVCTSSNVYAKAIFYIVKPDGTLVDRTWTSGAFNFTGNSINVTHTVDVQSIADLPAEGWIIGIELRPFAVIEDATKFTSIVRDFSSETQSLRFLNTQFMPTLYPNGYVIKGQETTPELAYDYVGNGVFEICITNPDADAVYAYKLENGDWTVLAAGVTSFEVSEYGNYYVKAQGTETTVDSVIVCMNIDGSLPAPKLSLGTGYTLTAPDDGKTYEYAKLAFNTTPVYQTLTSATLTAGVWAVRVAGDGYLKASKPQYIYIEGEDAGDIIFATAAGNNFVEGRWTGINSSATLFDFRFVQGKKDTPYGGTAFEIYQQFTVNHIKNKTYPNYGYRYLFSENEIIPVSTLKDMFATVMNSVTILCSETDSTRVTAGKTLVRVYVVGANVPYYDVVSDANVNGANTFSLSSLSNKEGYVVAFEIFPLRELHDTSGNVLTDPYMASASSLAYRFSNLKVADESMVLNTTGKAHSGIVDNKHKFELVLASHAEAPTLSVERAGDKFRIKITDAVEGATYQYKSETSGWTILDENETSFVVDTAGTYYVKSLAGGTLLSSEAATLTFAGVKPTPTLVPDENNVITAPEGETYQYAKLGYGVTPEYNTFTTAELTPGLWGVKVLGSGTYLDSDSQIIHVMGDTAGTIAFAKTSGTTITKGLWTGTKGVATLFDWDNYTNPDKIFTDENIEIYAAFSKSWLEGNTFHDYGYRYMLKDEEIVPLSDLVDLSATVRNGTTITMNGQTVNYTRTRARVHIAGGDVAYYDVYTDCKFTSAPGFVFDLSSLNDKKGYVTAIELYLFDEFIDANGNVLVGPFTTNLDSTSYGITFANLILHEDVELANKDIGNTGLSADGENRYSLRIANDPRCPKFETLSLNPNGLRITNYIQGATYAWAKSTNGPWTEFTTDTVEFTAFGEYYIKLVGEGGEDDIINFNPFVTDSVVIEGTSLVLDGAIGIKMYFGVKDGVKYTASYSVVDTETEKVVYSNTNATAISSTTGSLYVQAPVYPKDAHKLEVYLTVTNTDNGKTYSAKSSVPYYIETIKAGADNPAYAAALGVVNAIETYTKHAKKYFYNTDDVLDSVTVDTADILAIADPVINEDSSFECASYYGSSLILEGETTLRHYFYVTDADAFRTYTAYLNEKEISCSLANVTGGKYYYYDISNISAHNLDKQYNFEIYDNSGKAVVKIEYSALNYVKAQIDDEKLVDLLKAFYNYHVESDDYYKIATNQGQRAEIMAAMNLAKETTPEWKEVPAYAPTKDGYTHIKAITYDGFDYKGGKTKIFAYVGFPDGASAEEPVPAIVLVHGGGGHPYAKWVKLWNDRGYAAIAMETTGYFPQSGTVCYTESENSNFTYGISGDFVEEGYVSAPSRSYPTTYTPVAEQWAYHGLSQVILAGNILRADERVDDDKIGITGVSWGGTMTSQVIGYDDRFAFAIPVYGTAYLSNEYHTFSNFNDPYVNSLWAAERNLDNADMPTFWFAYNDDNNFSVPAYCRSYLHTADMNEKNTLLMLGNWSHSHGSVFNKMHSFWYADWVVKGTGGFVTFEDQPKGTKVYSKLNIPEGVTNVSAKVYYITEPMSYSVFDKYNWGNSYKFLTPYWQTDDTCLTVDTENSVVSGTIPAEAEGYYVNIVYTIAGETESCETSSVYVAIDN